MQSELLDYKDQVLLNFEMLFLIYLIYSEFDKPLLGCPIIDESADQF